VRFQFSAAEQEKVRACVEKLQSSSGSSGSGNGGGQLGGGGGQLGGGGGQAGGPGRGFDRGAFAKCLPAQVRNFQKTIVTPEQTIQQVVNPPQTNIKSSSYSIAGVDPTTPNIGLVTPSLLS